MGQPLLEGETRAWDDPGTAGDRLRLRSEIARLEQINRQLDEALRLERIRTQTIEAGVRELRTWLTPAYQAMRKIFGEMDEMGIVETVPLGQSNAKWDVWRKRFPGRGAELIDLLLVQGQMNTKQLSTALKCDPRTLAQLIYKLNQASLIQKNGNMFSLKEI